MCGKINHHLTDTENNDYSLLYSGFSVNLASGVPKIGLK